MAALMGKNEKVAFRLAMILTKINNGESLNKKELAREFGISEKTIERDMEERFIFLPIEYKNGEYFVEEYALGKLSFKDIQNFAKISSITELYGELDRNFIVDLLNIKINHIYKIKNQGYESLNKQLFKIISSSILRKTTIQFHYNDKPRFVNPYKLLNNNSIWYLLATQDGKLKHFTLSKIQKYQALEDQHFQSDNNIEKQIEQNNIQWVSNELTEVVLEIDIKAWGYFSRKSTLANQNIIEKTDEFITLSTKISFDDEILNIVKSYIPYIRILSPLSIKEKLELQLQKYIKDNK